MPMRRPRASIRAILATIAVAAVGMIAIVSSSRLWGNLCYSMAGGSLLIAVIGALCGRGDGRAFAIGFLAGGGALFFAHYGPTATRTSGDARLDFLICDLIYPYTVPSSAQLAAATPAVGPYRSMPEGLIRANDSNEWAAWVRPERTLDPPDQNSPAYFRRALLGLLSIGLGWVGGAIGVRFHRAGAIDRADPGLPGRAR